jgi:transcriptional regulator with XRE-family HTH domain
MLSERLRCLREAEGMTQVELAKILSVSKQSVSNWENDNIQPSIDMLVKITNVFSVSADYLLGIDTRRYIEVTDLTEKEIAHIRLIIQDIKQNR